MFHIEVDPETKEHVLVAKDGGKIPVREDVWERLKDVDEIFSEWKQLLRKWSIHVDKAPLLKTECSTESEYRELRTVIRTFESPAASS